jgi:mono/diheme cytochrome c family protein
MKRPFASFLFVIVLAACRAEMHDQPKKGAFKESAFFANHSAARLLPEGVVPRGYLRTNAPFFDGLAGTNLVQNIPIKLTSETLARGKERFEIYCAVCHGFTGEANGMIVQRGFPKPPSFDEERLRTAPIGHFYRVIAYGYGVMFPYAARIEPEDRWAIAAYIRALQMSRSMNIADLPAADRAKLQEDKP